MDGSVLRRTGDQPRRTSRRSAHAALLAVLCLGAILACASPASAVIVHLQNGKALSYEPVRGQSPTGSALQPFDTLFTNLDYNGGPVMPSNTNYAVYWDPSGAPAYPADYQPGLNRYFEDLAHDSGGHENVDSVATQYNDAAGESASYSSHFGGALIDTHAYPKNGCTRATICLTDAQLQAELTRYVKELKLPTDLAHEYFLLPPPGVESCFEAEGNRCSAGVPSPAFCAYHGAIPLEGASVIVYANDPYVAGGICDDGNHPNGTTADATLSGGLSHEHNESLTDPEPNNAWTDFATGSENGYEIGDKCRTFKTSSEFGTPLGKAADGASYNQVINGHLYWYQQEWSNQKHVCKQRFTVSGEAPTATFTSTAGAGNEMTLDASGSTAPSGVTRYSWQFNDLGGPGTPTETSTATVKHTFPGTGTYNVALTVFASDGTSIGAARRVTVGAPVVVTDPASAITQTSATMNGTVNPKGATVSNCEFKYGTTSSYGLHALCASGPGSGSSPVPVSAAATGLAPNTTYHFRLMATNARGTTEGEDKTVTTAPEPAPEPTPVVVPGTEPVSTTPITLVSSLGAVGTLSSVERKAPAVPDAELVSASLTGTPAGAVGVRVSCPATESSCAGTITLKTLSAVSTARGAQARRPRKAIVTLAVGTFMVSGGHVASLTLHLSPKARALLARTHVLRGRATILAHDPAGATHSAVTLVTIRPSKAHRGKH